MVDIHSPHSQLEVGLSPSTEDPALPGRPKKNQDQRSRHTMLAANILEGLLVAGKPSAKPRDELSRLLREKKDLTLHEAFKKLSDSRRNEIYAKLGRDFVDSLFEVSRSANPKMFSKGIDSLANDYLSLGRITEAGFLYSSLLEFTPEEFSEFRENVQRRLNGMQGVGDAADRFQFQAGQFWRQTFEGVSLGSMAGAQFIFGVGRWGFAKGLPRAVPALWGRLGKTGRLTLAGIPAFGLETLGFAGLQRGLGNLAGHPESGLSFVEEWKHAAWNLGFLKTFMGGASVWMGRRYAGVLPAQLKLRDRIIQTTVPQGAMMGGIYTGHVLGPHVGIGQHLENPTHGIDTLVFWAQFNLSGFALNRIPGWKKMNLKIHRETDAAAAGLTTDAKDKTNPILRKLESMLKYSKKGNWNVGFDPNDSLPEIPTMDLVTPPRSAEEARYRTLALGLNADAVAYLRMGMEQLRHSPASQERFLNLMERISDFQGRDCLSWDLILRGLSHPNPERANKAARKLLDALARLAPGSHPEFARALLTHELTKDFKTEQDYLQIPERPHETTDRQSGEVRIKPRSDSVPETNGITSEGLILPSGRSLLEMGIRPEAIKAQKRNLQGFATKPLPQARLLLVLDHPLLNSETHRKATQELRDSFEQFIRIYEELRIQHGKDEAKIEKINKEIASTSDIERRAELEKEKKEISRPVDEEYTKAAFVKLKEAMTKFQSDPLRARILLIENTRLNDLQAGLLRANPDWLAEQLKRQLLHLTGSARSATKIFLKTKEELDLVSGRSSLSRLYFGALRFFNKDPHPPHEVLGRYEKALWTLVEDVPLNHWKLDRVQEGALAQAVEAQREYAFREQEFLEEIRLSHRETDGVNDLRWRGSDPEEITMRTIGVENQLKHEQDLAQFLGASIGFENFLQKYGEAYQKKLEHALELVENYRNPSTRGEDSIKQNRSKQKAAHAIADFRHMVRSALKSEGFTEPAEARPMDPFMQPYVDKVEILHAIELAWKATNQDGGLEKLLGTYQKLNPKERAHLLETIAAALPPATQALFQSNQFLNSLERQETGAMSDWHFAKYSIDMMRKSGSRHAVNPNTDAWVELSSIINANAHASWIEFLKGMVQTVRLAHLRPEARGWLGILRIGAKKGLDKLVGPVFGPAIKYFTEPVAEARIDYDTSVTNLALEMALGSRERAQPGPRSTAVFDELTMSVDSMINPWYYHPYPVTSAILPLPLGGRSLLIADRYMALTGRSPNLILSTTLNGYRVWPKPDLPYPLFRGPHTTVNQLMPYLSINEPNWNRKETAANWLRSWLFTLSTVPEYHQPVPMIEKILEPYRQPGEFSIEAKLASRFGEVRGFYPTPDRIRGLEAELRNISAMALHGDEKFSEGARASLPFLNKALEVQTWQVLRTRLALLNRRLQGELEEKGFDHPLGRTIRALDFDLQLKLNRLKTLEEEISRGKKLAPKDQEFFRQAAAALAGREDVAGKDPTLQALDFYFWSKDHGMEPMVGFHQAQYRYHQFLNKWNIHRHTHQQSHVREAEGYRAVSEPYEKGLQAVLELYGFSPKVADYLLDSPRRMDIRRYMEGFKERLQLELDQKPELPDSQMINRWIGEIDRRLDLLTRVESKIQTEDAPPFTEQEKQFILESRRTWTHREDAWRTMVYGPDVLMDYVEKYIHCPDFLRTIPFVADTFLEIVLEKIPRKDFEGKDEVMEILSSRQKLYDKARHREGIGEPLTPVEKIVLEEFDNALLEWAFDDPPGPQDRLIMVLRDPKFSPEKIQQVLAEEKIREETRALVEDLPGGGRGTIDPLEESIKDASLIMLNGAGAVVGFTSSRRNISSVLTRFIVNVRKLVKGAQEDVRTAGTEHATNNYYEMGPPIASGFMASTGFRPVVSFQDVRVLENYRIEAFKQGRSKLLFSNHLSWFDITALMNVINEVRFLAKDRLLRVPWIGTLLKAAPHPLTSRGRKSKGLSKKEKVAQIKEELNAVVIGMREHGHAVWSALSGTRSLASIPGQPKHGVAHLAKDTQALILNVGILGTDDIMPKGFGVWTRGPGMNRKVYTHFDTMDLHSLGMDDPAKITHYAQQRLFKLYQENLGDLRDRAQTGDILAQAQLAEILEKIKPGMELVRRGEMEAAKAWAAKKSADYKLLEKFTYWWDSQAPLATPHLHRVD